MTAKESSAVSQSIEDVLKERRGRYGTFMDNSTKAQILKDVVHGMRNWSELKDDQKEALDNIMQKVARLMNGDPDYLDNWVDIAGYATLVVERLKND